MMYPRLSIILFIPALALFTVAKSKILQSPSTGSYYLLCGTYTHGTSKGIQEYLFTPGAAKLTFVRTIPLSNPSYLCFTKSQQNVYAVSEDEKTEGTVTAFSFDGRTGALKVLGKRPSGGVSPCYVSVSDDNRTLFVANYSSGTVCGYRLAPGGGFDNSASTVIRDKGSGPNKERQESAHAHSAVISPEQTFLFTADLGTDKEMIYAINRHKGSRLLIPAPTPFVKLVPGSGPRHFIFHPNGLYAYLIQELNATVTAFKYRDGKLDSIQTIKLEPANFGGKLGAADIHLSPDGKFLYASNRGDANDLSIFSVAVDGTLNFLDRLSCGGKTPRNFTLDPTGNFLLVANQDSDNVVVFKRDPATGMLGKPLFSLPVSQPVCLKFAQKL